MHCFLQGSWTLSVWVYVWLCWIPTLPPWCHQIDHIVRIIGAVSIKDHWRREKWVANRTRQWCFHLRCGRHVALRAKEAGFLDVGIVIERDDEFLFARARIDNEHACWVCQIAHKTSSLRTTRKGVVVSTLHSHIHTLHMNQEQRTVIPTKQSPKSCRVERWAQQQRNWTKRKRHRSLNAN